MTAEQREALMLALHEQIEGGAAEYAAAIHDGPTPALTYPPNCGFSKAEAQALRRMEGDAAAESALRKVLAQAASDTVYYLLSMIDGTIDLSGDVECGCFVIVEGENPDDFLHSEFLATYWGWRDRRPDPGWKLDIYDDASGRDIADPGETTSGESP